MHIRISVKSAIFSFCLFFQGFLFAQTPDSVSTSNPDSVVQEVEVILPESIFQADIAVERYGLDKKIDNGFAPISNQVAGLIFYAPNIGKDIIYTQTDSAFSARKFYNQPPFRVVLNTKKGGLMDKAFKVTATPEGDWLVTYPRKATIPVGKPVLIEDMTLTVTKNAVEANGTHFPISYKIEGQQELARSFQFSIPAMPEEADLTQLQTVELSYEGQLRIKPNEPIVIDGFEFTLVPNAESAYSMTPGKVYTFQVVPVKFLPIVVLFLIIAALFFTFYFKFVNIRKFGLAINVVRGAYTDPNEAGEVSHFQALTAALSGTVGLGNIAGVAIAITIGGAGATFWMIVAGLLGMSTKFIECTLGVTYRTIDNRGVVSGGPMYYLSQGLKEKGMAGLGKFFAAFFAVMAIGGSFGGGNMFQVNQAYKQLSGLEFMQGSWFASNGWAFGVVVALMVGVVIIGGIKSIAKVTDKLVPFMVVIYLIAGFIVIGMNFEHIPRCFADIFEGAFSPVAIAGGFIGVLIQGFRRAAFSNEAGVGSASIAHSAVRTNNPASEGIVALLEPFIDTVVVCTMTALVIIITNHHLDTGAADGVALTSKAFSSELPFFKYILALAVLLFAFSTMISWSYYGLKAWTYLFGNTPMQEVIYKVLFCLVVVVGAAGSLNSITDFSDAMIFAMAVPNLIGLFILAPRVQKELNSYLGKIKSGEIVRVK